MQLGALHSSCAAVSLPEQTYFHVNGSRFYFEWPDTFAPLFVHSFLHLLVLSVAPCVYLMGHGD